MKYGQIKDYNLTPQQFRMNCFFNSMNRVDFGNGGVPSLLQEYLDANRGSIEDVFIDNDSLYLLPSSKEYATELFNLCVNDGINEDYMALADEISWLKLGDRYYLHLWFD